MYYLLFICSDGTATPEKAAAMSRECPRWVAEMDGRGVRVFGRQLGDPSTAVTIRVREGETLVTDGPFVESKEFVAGIDVLECADLDEAIEIAAAHPVPWFHDVEIRPFVDGLELGERARAFGKGDDAGRTAYCLMLCLDGIPAEPDVEASVVREGSAWFQEMEARGIIVLAHPLRHKDAATTVRVRDGETLLSDGPFVETKEFVGGIAVILGDSRQEAIEIAAAHPLARHHMIEVRPFSGG